MAAYARGIRNSAFFNRSPEGDTVWFVNSKARDGALEALRALAVLGGVGRKSSTYGIVPVARRFRTAAERDAFLDDVEAQS